jgi:hypothetical protein
MLALVTPLQTSARRQRTQVYLWSAVIFVVFSILVSIFKVKNRGTLCVSCCGDPQLSLCVDNDDYDSVSVQAAVLSAVQAQTLKDQKRKKQPVRIAMQSGMVMLALNNVFIGTHPNRSLRYALIPFDMLAIL